MPFILNLTLNSILWFWKYNIIPWIKRCIIQNWSHLCACVFFYCVFLLKKNNNNVPNFYQCMTRSRCLNPASTIGNSWKYCYWGHCMRHMIKMQETKFTYAITFFRSISRFAAITLVTNQRTCYICLPSHKHWGINVQSKHPKGIYALS